MPILKSLINYLDDLEIKYDIVEHKTVYTAFDKAATLKVRPQAIIKTLIIKVAPGEYAFALLPAHRNLDKEKFIKAINKWRAKQDLKDATQASLALERWIRKNIKGQVGAIPPYGEIYGYPTVIDASLTHQRDLYLNTGDYTKSIRITKSRWAKSLGEHVMKAAISKAKAR